MKTAMQELIFHIAYMERRKYQDEQEKIIGGMNDCIMNDAIVIQSKVIEELTKEYAEYLETERKQHETTFHRGINIGAFNPELDIKGRKEASKHYYECTFGQLDNQNNKETKKMCENKVDGVCPLHNLFCKYPDCEE